MSEQHSTPTDNAELPGGTQTQPAEPIVPLRRPSVQATIVCLVIVSLVGILWAGRTTLWPAPAPRNLVRPSVLLQIDINQAGKREFALLPGVGPVLANRIVADRTEHGPFASIQDLARVHGIGAKTIDQIAVYCLCISDGDAMVALVND